MLVHLGPFTLDRPIARGGMAEVWRGVHRAQQVPVAVKVLTGPNARDPTFRAAITNEIHAVAKLQHPGVILVYDKGTVDDDAEAHSNGRLVSGSPWFAMELCSQGALSPRRFPLSWPIARTLLLSLLDALAHAHARGVIHRDLKPGNVLLCAPDDPRPGLKLSDFGIAHATGTDDDNKDTRSGTPRYMAPEQFMGETREIGPWTDLYAVGCIAYQLVTAAPPFSGDAMRLSVAHCHDAVPHFDTSSFPEGYEAWVLRLMEKSPRDRFQKAADAAWALLALGDDEVTAPHDWSQALRSLTPRENVGAASNPDETAAHTLGPISRVEHPSIDLTPAPPPGVDEPTGPVRDSTDMPTALARREGSAALRSRVGTEPPLTAPTGHPAGAPAPRIDDDDPFAAVLAITERGDDDEAPHTDPRSIAPRAPWVELSAPRSDHSSNRSDRDYPTIGNPFSLPPTDAEPGERRRMRSDPRPRAETQPPPIPPSWRRPDEPTSSPQRLTGVGTALYGLRQPPFVGRDNARDDLWRALLDAKDGTDSVVVVRGPAGIGRTRLVQWFGERAIEVGAATVVWATHAEETGPADGIRGALARSLRVRRGGDALGVRALVHEALPQLADDDIAVLTATLTGAERTSAHERHASCVRALRLLAKRRPVIVVIDDAQWGDDALDLARALLNTAPMSFGRTERDAVASGVIMVVATLDEALVERPQAAAKVEELVGDARTMSIALSPLSTEEQRQLIDAMLVLEPSLADTLAHRSGGNPRFVVELLGALIERDSLELVPDGFALRRGAVIAIPETMHAAWSARLERLLHTLPEGARIALELLAALGEDDERQTLIDVVEQATGSKNDAKIFVAHVQDALERARFVVRDARLGSFRMRFTHAMLKETLLQQAKDQGRLAQHHEAIASVLSRRGKDGDDERRARHLLAAGRIDDALPALCDAIDDALSGGSTSHAERLLDDAFAALDRNNVSDTDAARQRVIALRARALIEAGRYDEGTMWGALVDNSVDAPVEAKIDALRARAQRHVRQGELDKAGPVFQELLDRATRDEVVDEALLGLGDVHYYQGQLDSAEAVLTRALSRAQDRGELSAVAWCFWSLGYVLLWRGDPQTARAALLRGSKLARARHLPTLQGLLRNALGDVERIAGSPHTARKHYAEARALLSRAGSGKVRTVDVNLALCDVSCGMYDDAARRAEALLPAVMHAKEQLTASLCQGVLAVCAAHQEDWSLAQAHLAAFMVGTQGTLIDGEHALLAEGVACEALRQGEAWRAGVAESLAKDVWTALGRGDRLEVLPSLRLSPSIG